MPLVKKHGLLVLRVLYVMLGALLVFDWQSVGLSPEVAAQVAGAILAVHHGSRLLLQALGVETSKPTRPEVE